MEGRLLDKEDILSSGKHYTKLRLPSAGADLNGFIFKGWDYPFQPEISHNKVSVYYIGKYAPNKNYRDVVSIKLETKSLECTWQLRLDDYVTGGILDLWRLQIDIDNIVAIFGKHDKLEIFRLYLVNGKEISLFSR